VAGRYYVHKFSKATMQWEIIERRDEVKKSIADRRREEKKAVKREQKLVKKQERLRLKQD
jgi:hypothetical protein